MVVEEECSLAGSKRLSKSSIDVSSTLEDEEPKRPLPRKQSDSSTYDCEAVTQQNRAATVAPNCRLTSLCNIQSPRITPSPTTALTEQRGCVGPGDPV